MIGRLEKSGETEIETSERVFPAYSIAACVRHPAPGWLIRNLVVSVGDSLQDVLTDKVCIRDT